MNEIRSDMVPEDYTEVLLIVIDFYVFKYFWKLIMDMF